MIKIRNKRIALLLVLAMLATMFVGVGAASASDYTDVSSGWRFVVADDAGQHAGDISIDLNDDYDTINGASAFTLWITVTLPDGVTWDEDSSVAINGVDQPGVVFDSTGDTETIKIPNAQNLSSGDVIDITDNYLAIDDGVTGSIIASVRAYAKDTTGEYLFDETDASVLIAKIDAGTVVSSAGKAKTVAIGEDQAGAKITVKETGPSAFDNPENITYTVTTPGVSFDWFVDDATDPSVWDTAFLFTNASSLTADFATDADKKVEVSFNTSNVTTEKLIFTPYFLIDPTVAEGTLINVKVSGDNMDTTTFAVAKVGPEDASVVVTNGDKDFVYRGQCATFEDVSLKIKPGTEGDFEESDWFTMTLPEGVTWENENPADFIPNNMTFDIEKIYNNNRTMWINVEYNSDSSIKIQDLQVIADANAVVGDLNITFGGILSGTAKVGSIKSAFTVSTVAFNAPKDQVMVAGNNILITETADGALKATNIFDEDYEKNSPNDPIDQRDEECGYQELDIALPAGVTFDGTPDVDVTTGDLEIGNVELTDDSRTLEIEITGESGVASVITISNVNLTVLNQPLMGNVVAAVGGEYNTISDKPLEKVTLGSVGLQPVAVFVIGASTFTLNGVSMPVVSPSYVKNNRTYLAIRDIGTALGIEPYNILWDNPTQTVTLVKGDKLVQMTIGSTIMKINGVNISMDVAPEYGPNDRSFLPAAFLAQAFGATAYWDGPNQTVTIKASTY